MGISVLLEKTLQRVNEAFVASTNEPMEPDLRLGMPTEWPKAEPYSEADIWIRGPQRADPTKREWLEFHLQHLWKTQGIKGWQHNGYKQIGFTGHYVERKVRIVP